MTCVKFDSYERIICLVFVKLFFLFKNTYLIFQDFVETQCKYD